MHYCLKYDRRYDVHLIDYIEPDWGGEMSRMEKALREDVSVGDPP